MSKRERKPKFIDGIFNYCDRWCERCPFTQRCRSFDLGEKIRRESERRDRENATFWKAMENVLGDAMKPLAEEVEKLALSAESNFDDDDDDFEKQQFAVKQDEQDRAVRRHPLARLSNVYLRSVNRWVNSHELLLARREEEPRPRPDQLTPLENAAEIIAWYYMFIHVKLCRALSGRMDDEEEGFDDLLDDDGVPFPRDSDGSAKIAVIGIERSIGAWSIVRDELPAERDTAKSMMLQLIRLRTLVERHFPDARQFHRPGFDDVDADSVG